MNFFKKLFSKSKNQPESVTPVLGVDQMARMVSPFENSFYDGSKFLGGFGDTKVYSLDYHTLRERSAQLFTENPYARGIIRRLVTNEINTGLMPEATPDEKTLGYADEALNDWTEDVEIAFDLWARLPAACDYQQLKSFGRLQAQAKMEAYVTGDVLLVLRYTSPTKLPQLQLISGALVETPISQYTLRKGHAIRHGVELDAAGRHIAYWVRQEDLSFKRLPAFGERSGRLTAKMIYGGDKRLDDVRGTPILSLVLQSLKEIDRYRDSTQRKAVINSFLALFIKKTADKPGSLPMTNGAIRRDQVAQNDTSRAAPARKLNVSSFMPGLVFDELQVGEEPVLQGGNGTDVNFGTFEEAIISAIAWSNEIPPEILKLSFSNNYSASQAAINEFKIYLNRIWSDFGEEFCTPIYTEWMLSAALAGKIDAPTLLEAWRDAASIDRFAAWTSADWYGSIKPSTDMLKQVKGSDLLVAGGYSTRAREARITTGTKYSKNIKRLKRENAQLADALRPILELRQEFSDVHDSEMPQAATDTVEPQAVLEDQIDAILGDYFENAERNTA